jgi:hypothetical protein
MCPARADSGEYRQNRPRLNRRRAAGPRRLAIGPNRREPRGRDDPARVGYSLPPGRVTVARPASGGFVKRKGISMLRKYIRAGMFVALGAVAMILAYGASSATAGQDKDKDEKVPTISEIMIKGHKGADSHIGKIRSAAKGAKWDDAKEYAKTLAFFGEHLGKNKPPKGDEKSWKTLTEKYAVATKSVVEAVDKKDAKAVNAALGKINCGECHKAHK